ncbi:hypothetical protein N7508_007158 [Penicillium antarcticum]|uniref:uncharacterized protein n=1 Tax=Penicillium antarcticum TaxID=416450 RepID=UPI00239588A3|nr:uncharacterized protein N7508_007158 [Penicillium antarcticum]KAJ5302295.1 hypothetical protein N7508_007158 [Penicillium antarcticum]
MSNVQEYVIERRKNEHHIVIPVSVLDAWGAKYGPDDLLKMIFDIERAVRAIDESRSRNNLTRDEIPRELYNHICNKNFLQNDIGRFVQAAMLVGDDIDPIRYFKGSDASWDEESRVKMIGVSLNGEKDRHGRDLMLLQVLYGGLPLNMVKNATEVLQILY